MTRSCAVCGRPAWLSPFGPAQGFAVCDAAPCRLVMDRRGAMSPLAFKCYLESQSRLSRERLAERERQEARIREQVRAEAAENTVRWMQAESQLAGGLPPRHNRLALPSGPRRLRNLPERQRRRYRDHLNQIIAAALTRDEYAEPTRTGETVGDKVDASGEAAALRGQLCAACGGGCCAEGGHTAYLTVPQMRRFMANHPAMRPRDVLEAYLDRVRERTEAGSCVNHAAGGCSLPREMRSETCNRFLCAPQHQVRAWQEGSAPPQALVVVLRRQNHWSQHREGRENDIVGTAVVTASGVTRLPG